MKVKVLVLGCLLLLSLVSGGSACAGVVLDECHGPAFRYVEDGLLVEVAEYVVLNFSGEMYFRRGQVYVFRANACSDGFSYAGMVVVCGCGPFNWTYNEMEIDFPFNVLDGAVDLEGGVVAGVYRGVLEGVFSYTLTMYYRRVALIPVSGNLTCVVEVDPPEGLDPRSFYVIVEAQPYQGIVPVDIIAENGTSMLHLGEHVGNRAEQFQLTEQGWVMIRGDAPGRYVIKYAFERHHSCINLYYTTRCEIVVSNIPPHSSYSFELQDIPAGFNVLIMYLNTTCNSDAYYIDAPVIDCVRNDPKAKSYKILCDNFTIHNLSGENITVRILAEAVLREPYDVFNSEFEIQIPCKGVSGPGANFLEGFVVFIPWTMSIKEVIDPMGYNVEKYYLKADLFHFFLFDPILHRRMIGTFTENGFYLIRYGIRAFKVTAVSIEQMSVAGAYVELRDSSGTLLASGVTGGDGATSLVPWKPGIYSVNVFVHDVLVGEATVDGLIGEASVTCDVKYVVAHVYDANSEPLQGAAVELFLDGKLICHNVTDENGEIALGFLPGNVTYTVEVLYCDVIVLFMENVTVMQLTSLYCEVGDFSVKVTDIDGKPVQGAMVTVAMLNGTLCKTATTDEEGKAFFERLPLTVLYRIAIEIDENVVENITVSVSNNLILNFTVPVRDLKVKVIDAIGNPVGNATVYLQLPNGSLIDKATTNSRGEVEFEKLMLGQYKVKVCVGNRCITVDVDLSAENYVEVKLKYTVVIFATPLQIWHLLALALVIAAIIGAGGYVIKRRG